MAVAGFMAFAIALCLILVFTLTNKCPEQNKEGVAQYFIIKGDEKKPKCMTCEEYGCDSCTTELTDT